MYRRERSRRAGEERIFFFVPRLTHTYENMALSVISIWTRICVAVHLKTDYNFNICDAVCCESSAS